MERGAAPASGRPPRTRRLAGYAAFALSGAAGLIYETVWSRYLALYVGNTAQAQVLVLVVFLGGMALGSLVIAERSETLRRPLVWYAAAEGILALAGLGFHPTFGAVTGFSYDVLFPALGSASLAGAARWGVAGLLILGQSVVLGATFPLMVAGLLRRDPGHPGRGTANAYLVNTLGGAAGVLLAGFWLVGTVGLPGAMAGGAVLNLLAAGMVLALVERGAPADDPVLRAPPPEGGAAPAAADDTPAWATRPHALAGIMLTVSFGTALASFAYEVAWIRMLSMVLGSATHAFELMLSAFILGLAVGSRAVRDLVDRARDPLRMLGAIQVLMGLAALASVPLYGFTFRIMTEMVEVLPPLPAGYTLFNMSRYALCLIVMLPATLLAGMTLPTITGTLLRAGRGERSVGSVYAWNTIGSVVGAALSGLVLLPLLQLKWLMWWAAALDVLLGLWLLDRSSRWARRGPWLAASFGAVAVVAFFLVGVAVALDPLLLGSGVFRYGRLPDPGERTSLYHADGRTATVDAYVGHSDRVIVLSTNGKPDASVGPRWFQDADRAAASIADSDYLTQLLAPTFGMAFRPDAGAVANIGHGSGLTGTVLLGGRGVERLTTVEIEPAMVDGSFVFYPLNAPIFEDPRSTFVFDDAKAFFSYAGGRFDLVFAEPSNPWVSGVSSLFTREFYQRARTYLAPGGVWAQWVQLYEFDDELFLSVLAALDGAFADYRGYLTGVTDLVIVASADGPLPEADWSVVETETFRRLTGGAPAFTPRHMPALLLFDRSTFRALLDGNDTPVNSDYRPFLDAGAERARFERTVAGGILSFGTEEFDLGRAISGRRQAPTEYAPPPAKAFPALTRWSRMAWMRQAIAAGGGMAPEDFPEWTGALLGLRNLYLMQREPLAEERWQDWAKRFTRVESALHFGTAGWADSTFYALAYDFMDRENAPALPRAAVDFSHGIAAWDWAQAAGAADVLLGDFSLGDGWVDPARLLDGAVFAYLQAGRPDAARRAIERLGPRTGRLPGNVRLRLLRALVDQAEGTR